MKLFFYSWHGEIISKSVTAASKGPTAHLLDNRSMNMEKQWNDIDGGNERSLRKTCPSVFLSTTNSTQPALAANPGLHGYNPATVLWHDFMKLELSGDEPIPAGF